MNIHTETVRDKQEESTQTHKRKMKMTRKAACARNKKKINKKLEKRELGKAKTTRVRERGGDEK